MNNGNVEHERRFLVHDISGVPEFSFNQPHEQIVQGYIQTMDGAALRVRRIISVDESEDGKRREVEPVLEYKGKRGANRRFEFRWPASPIMAGRLMKLAKGVVYKRRFPLMKDGHAWEVDVFDEKNRGLVIAELETEQALSDFERPPWCGEDLAAHRQFDNEMLALYPICDWSSEQLNRFSLKRG